VLSTYNAIYMISLPIRSMNTHRSLCVGIRPTILFSRMLLIFFELNWLLFQSIYSALQLTNVFRVFPVDVAFGLLHVHSLVDITREKCSQDVELLQFKILRRRDREEQSRAIVASYRRERVAIVNTFALIISPYN